MEAISECEYHSLAKSSVMQVIFNFDGKAMSLKDKRNLYDHNKQLIVNMTQKVWLSLLS